MTKISTKSHNLQSFPYHKGIKHNYQQIEHIESERLPKFFKLQDLAIEKDTTIAEAFCFPSLLEIELKLQYFYDVLKKVKDVQYYTF